MNENEVEHVLLKIDGVDINSEIYEVPNEVDWKHFKQQFGTDFGETFVSFTKLMSRFNFTGETLKITFDDKNLNEEIYSVYEHECLYESWEHSMLPIIRYGDGDYICLNITEGDFSKVYLFDHEAEVFRWLGESFEEWLLHTDGYG